MFSITSDSLFSVFVESDSSKLIYLFLLSEKMTDPIRNTTPIITTHLTIDNALLITHLAASVAPTSIKNKNRTIAVIKNLIINYLKLIRYLVCINNLEFVFKINTNFKNVITYFLLYSKKLLAS